MFDPYSGLHPPIPDAPPPEPQVKWATPDAQGIYDATAPTKIPATPPTNPYQALPQRVTLETQLGKFTIDLQKFRSNTQYFKNLLQQLDPTGQAYNTLLRALQPKVSAEFADGTKRTVAPLGEISAPHEYAGPLKWLFLLLAGYGAFNFLRNAKPR